MTETKKLFAEGFGKLTADELAKLLEHPDQQVRQRAQLELAEQAGRKPDRTRWTSCAKNENQFARFHAVWGLGQIARKSPVAVKSIAAGSDKDAEVRAQAAKVIGDVGTPGRPLSSSCSTTRPAGAVLRRPVAREAEAQAGRRAAV